MTILSRFNFSNVSTVVGSFATLSSHVVSTSATDGGITATVTTAFQSSDLNESNVRADDPIFLTFPRNVLTRSFGASSTGGEITYTGLQPNTQYKFAYMCPAANGTNASINDGTTTVTYITASDPANGQVTFPAEIVSTSDGDGEIVHTCFSAEATTASFGAVIISTPDTNPQYYLDFSGLANVNPYTPPTEINYLNSTSFQIISGTLRPTFGTNGISFLRFNNSATTGIIAVHVKQNHDQALFSDNSCPALLNASGNGYILEVNGNLIRLRTVVNFVITAGSSIIALDTQYNVDDVFTLSRDLDSVNGDMSIYLNGYLIGTAQDNTYPTGLGGGFIGIWANSNSSGAVSIGFDGLATQTVEITSPDIVVEGTANQNFNGNGFGTTQGTGSLILRDKVNIVNAKTLTPSNWTASQITANIQTGWLQKLSVGVSTQVFGIPFTSPNYVLEIVVETDSGAEAVRDVSVNPPSGWTLLETTIATANTTEGESVLAYATIQDNMQWLAPNSVLAQDGVTTVNFTWNSNGTFTCDSPEMVQLNILAFDVVTYEISMQPLLIGFNQVMPLTITGPDSITEGQAFTVTFTA